MAASLDLVEVIRQTVEAFIPELSVALEPLRGFLEAICAQPTRSPLRVATALDQSCSLEHLEMLGDCRQAHRQGRCELAHRRLALGKPREDLAAGGSARAENVRSSSAVGMW
jgi:hypothetical protein